MIGQEKLLNQFSIEHSIKDLPRFIVITGEPGQGKKTLAKEIAKRFNLSIANIDIKIDNIRDMLHTAYEQTSPILYLIADADDMSLGAKNSLLKVIEEPPQQAYFIMTLEQIENTLATIKSRAYEIRMQSYSLDEKQKMIDELLPNATQDEKLILSKFDNYGQIEKVIKYGPKEFDDYVIKVFDNIYKVQSANSFKLVEKLDLKDEGSGYDLDLFWLDYLYVSLGELYACNMQNDWDTTDTICKCLGITEKYRNMLSIRGVNKQMLVDNWILAIRKVWLQDDKNRD